ncbi:glycoside hydrolase family 19 protein [Tumidithrix elongata RA019]|uniref:Glycoside hydrolase family 19 protein n=1 Tax=Tumidithrix elongata BACA0141 TaxID=2716417 RepID=A0AAW9PWV0_9CYAN|nr:glycoside hydrolase family 19 protein [Tumidithrix elongata RA019]
MGQVEIWREQAAKSLASMIPKIQGNAPTAQDGLVDDLLRVLNKLPARPEGRQPYAGLFPSADIFSWRNRAASIVQTLVPKIQNLDVSSFDGAIDNLVRATKNLPSRPAGRPPYAGLFPPANVDTWRKQAAASLGASIPSITSKSFIPNDTAIDDLIRAMSNLPLRPILRKPYEGLFQGTDIPSLRRQAGERLKNLVTNLQNDPNPVDVQVDNLIRTLNKLPSRPANQAPYAGLFAASPTVSSPPVVTPPPKALITQTQLTAIAPYSDPARLAKLLPYLNATMVEYAINTPLRIAHFIAQTAHESDAYNTNEEYASGADYEGRGDLGNVNPGDGVRFKGRGLIQVTGRANYAECGKALGIDLVSNPQRLGDFDLACRSAGWFWRKMELNGDADNDDIMTITRLVNGGYNGLEDRQDYLDRAKQVFGI